MELKEFDKVTLTTGETAYIVDLYSGDYVVADVEREEGTMTEFVKRKDIVKVVR